MTMAALKAGTAVAVSGLLYLATPAASRATVIGSTEIETPVPFTSDAGAVSMDVSGFSCLVPKNEERVCLAIDDQGRLAQATTFADSKLTARGKIRILGNKAPAPDIVGAPPKNVACRESAKFKDLDGEAVANDGEDFFVAGSHGCSRNSAEFSPSSFILARIPASVVANAVRSGADSVIQDASTKTTYRLSEALLLAPGVKSYFGRNLMNDNGLNVEGIAVSGGLMFVGLRAPVLDGQAFIVTVPIDALFDPAIPIRPVDITEIKVDLGGRGIRDISMLADGTMILLAGPAQLQPIGYALFQFDPRTSAVSLLAEFDGLAPGAKAEALQVLKDDGQRLDAIIMFDGVKGGGARRYVIER